ncbi:hypothetical protein GKZ28_14055 [Clostridium chromiireducens]|uniref:NACHT domain-containing protein n=1 Tax=Clostridium chromiireducens TaxID=225345 RepID=A0A964RNI0_9CLOT|nr:hypothetical protein [Clostridium chromiireducens]MVX64818.1 hypothetical protein [Clostridium chromiireducens]
MIDKERIEECVVQVECVNKLNPEDKTLGTGFFIKNNTVITASHVINKYYSNTEEYYINIIPIKLINSRVIKATGVKETKRNNFISILEIEEEVEIVNPLRFITDYLIERDNKYFTFGFPELKRLVGHPVENTVGTTINPNQSKKADWDLMLGSDRLENFEGFSGAPVIINNMLIGIIQTQSDANGRALSIAMSSIEMIKEFIPEEYYINLYEYINEEYSRSIDKLLCAELDEKNFISRILKENEYGKSTDFEKALTDEKNYLILAEPGGGKSNLLLKAIRIINKKRIGSEFKLPILLKLREYGINYDSIESGIFFEINKYINDISSETISKLIKKGRMTILLDGLDEIKNENYGAFLSDIRSLLLNYYGNKFIITCRKNVYANEIDNQVIKLNLQQLIAKDIREYFIAKCGYIIPSNYNIDLLKVPLLLNIASEVVKKNGNLPKCRVKLYRDFVDELIQKWNLKKGNRINISTKMKISKIISFISYKTFEENFITEYQLWDLINSQFDYTNLDEIIEYVLNIGILERSNDDKIWFKHRTYKEYFAALYIIHEINYNKLEQEIDRIVNDRQYSEVIVFMSGLFENWEKQNVFLDYILKKNLKLYVQCVEEKNNLSESLIKLSQDEYCNLYLYTVLKTYKDIIDIYFPSIKEKFNPYKYNRPEENNLCIIGNISNDKTYVHYMYVIKRDGEELELLNTQGFQECVNKFYREVRSFDTKYLNLDLSNLSLDSAREVAIIDIKEQVKKLIEKQLLFESDYLKCERLLEISRKIPSENRTEIVKMLEWVNHKIDESPIKCDSYQYNGIELISLKYYLDDLCKRKIDFQECILPQQDLQMQGTSCFTRDLYSGERILERLKYFFVYGKKSITEMIEINFYELRNTMPSYFNLPYKYVVNYSFREQKSNNYSFSDIVFEYYYTPSETSEEEVELVKVENRVEIGREIIDKLHQTYEENKYLGSATITSTSINTILDNDALRKYVYGILKHNVEFIFGKL